MADPRTTKYDLIIAGAGSMGAAAAYYAARSGLTVLALEKFSSVPHDHGSHAGQSRIIRKAYFEDPGYVPLLRTAYDLWAELESLTGQQLFVRNGLMYSAPPGHAVIEGVKQAASLNSIPVKQVSSFSHFIPCNNELLFEPDAGFVLPERAITLFAAGAVTEGARLHMEESLVSWKQEKKGITVFTDKDKYLADKLIICSGAWMKKILEEQQLPLTITRQLLVWVDPVNPEQFFPENFPCWMIATGEMAGVYYGFPYLDGKKYPGPTGMKFAWHQAAVETDPDKVNRKVSKEEIDALIEQVAVYFPASRANVVAAKTCLYSNTPDENFIIDHLPGTEEKVIIACGFSGHGFKFAPAIGKLLADMAINGKKEQAIDFLGLGRFRQ